MENLEQEASQEIAEDREHYSLWLTDRILTQLRSSSKVGVPFIVLCILSVISIVSHSLYPLLLRWSQEQGDFYLLEGRNLYRLFQLLSTLFVTYCFARFIIEGNKTWRLLRYSESSDDALLEGTERLGKMFFWLTFCGGAYLGSLIVKTVWRYAM